MKLLQSQVNRGKMIPQEAGFLICPRCRRNRKLLQVHPETEAQNLTVFCRVCKREIKLDIEKGQGFESSCQ